MDIGVCVPYRPVDEEREGNLLRTRRQWDELGWPVFLGDHPRPELGGCDFYVYRRNP